MKYSELTPFEDARPYVLDAIAATDETGRCAAHRYGNCSKCSAAADAAMKELQAKAERLVKLVVPELHNTHAAIEWWDDEPYLELRGELIKGGGVTKVWLNTEGGIGCATTLRATEPNQMSNLRKVRDLFAKLSEFREVTVHIDDPRFRNPLTMYAAKKSLIHTAFLTKAI